MSSAIQATGERPILVTGVNGQVGHALLKSLTGLGRIVPVSKDPDPAISDLVVADFADQASLRDLVRRTNPRLIVNPAAYTAVDKAETEAALAQVVNATAPGILAAEAARVGAGFIHYSTDYVFDGSGSTPRAETAATAPLNVYGSTKLAGEASVMAGNPAALVLRTSWVFSDIGANFVKTMLRLAQEREVLKVVSDQVGAPTSAAFLASMTARVVQEATRVGRGDLATGLRELRGIYHLTCAGETSWHGFAVAIFEMARLAGLELKVREVVGIPASEYPTPAKRPQNSRLVCDKFCQAFNVPALQHWTDALRMVMQALTQSAGLSLSR